MAETVRLKLPLIDAAQAQKHVTHNEALVMLDLLTGIIPVLDRDLDTPPGGESDGDVYILGGAGSGGWAGYAAGDLALRLDGAWRRVLPSTGMVASVADQGGALVYWDGADWAGLGGLGGGREVLTAARTYYVRTDGDDGNDGLADTAGGAFATIQKAIDTVAALDLGIYGVTIQMGAGTYADPVVLKTLTGAGSVTLRGNPSAPGDVEIARSGGAVCIEAVNIVGDWRIDGVQLTIASASSNSWSVWANGPTTTLRYQNVDFGASGRQVVAENGAFVRKEGPCIISGGGVNHLFIRVGATYDNNGGGDTTFVGAGLTAAFTGQFAVCATGAVLYQPNGVYVDAGSVTGNRYAVSRNGVIQIPGGGGASFFPGDVAGSEATGGQYG